MSSKVGSNAKTWKIINLQKIVGWSRRFCKLFLRYPLWVEFLSWFFVDYCIFYTYIFFKYQKTNSKRSPMLLSISWDYKMSIGVQSFFYLTRAWEESQWLSISECFSFERDSFGFTMQYTLNFNCIIIKKFKVIIVLDHNIILLIWLAIDSLFTKVESIRAVIKKELDLPIVEISDENAKLDGGDVLFTGKILLS